MRLKTLNFSGRSDSFSPITSKLVKEMTGDLNKMGTLFDKFVELETFIFSNIIDEFEELISIRENRKNIEEENGQQSYLNDYFLPAAKTLESKIDTIIEEWNLINNDFDSNKIIKIGDMLKSFKVYLNDLLKGNNLNTIEIMKQIIDDFGRFKSIGCMASNNIALKIEVLLQSKENILKIKNDVGYLEEIEIDDLSIDDL